jgi:hypothetical protein
MKNDQELNARMRNRIVSYNYNKDHVVAKLDAPYEGKCIAGEMKNDTTGYRVCLLACTWVGLYWVNLRDTFYNRGGLWFGLGGLFVYEGLFGYAAPDICDTCPRHDSTQHADVKAIGGWVEKSGCVPCLKQQLSDPTR